jgi:hypothetical protein
MKSFNLFSRIFNARKNSIYSLKKLFTSSHFSRNKWKKKNISGYLMDYFNTFFYCESELAFISFVS